MQTTKRNLIFCILVLIVANLDMTISMGLQNNPSSKLVDASSSSSSSSSSNQNHQIKNNDNNSNSRQTHHILESITNSDDEAEYIELLKKIAQAMIENQNDLETVGHNNHDLIDENEMNRFNLYDDDAAAADDNDDLTSLPFYSEEDNHLVANKRAFYKLAKKESSSAAAAAAAAAASKGNRRQQAARWDIGFGKRSQKPKAFMDALYGKRNYVKHSVPKVSFGRKQQWDIQYGRK